jgi:putative protease
MEKEIGKITHYFDKIQVAIVELKDKISIGDEIHIKGNSTDFTQKVESIQIEKKPVEKADKGELIGLKVKEKTRVNDIVYKILPEESS